MTQRPDTEQEVSVLPAEPAVESLAAEREPSVPDLVADPWAFVRRACQLADYGPEPPSTTVPPR
jgi:hypothetical protein